MLSVCWKLYRHINFPFEYNKNILVKRAASNRRRMYHWRVGRLDWINFWIRKLLKKYIHWNKNNRKLYYWHGKIQPDLTHTTQEAIAKLGWQVQPCGTYSRNLLYIDYYLFQSMNNAWADRRLWFLSLLHHQAPLEILLYCPSFDLVFPFNLFRYSFWKVKTWTHIFFHCYWLYWAWNSYIPSFSLNFE